MLRDRSVRALGGRTAGVHLLGVAWMALFSDTVAQGTSDGPLPPSTFPHTYPGMPNTTYGPDWQEYYRVPSLPYTSSIPSAFAGSVSVNREGHPNNTLFFMAFEKEEGSLTAPEGERTDEPWMIWLNGGPGSSSMYGLFSENGPLQFGLAAPDADPSIVFGSTSFSSLNYTVTPNPYSWHTLASIFYIDQPVGTGYSTSDATGYIADEDDMGIDFVQFLGNVVKIFPSLGARPLILSGESYAGVYIPYITKTLLNTENPPVNLAKIAIGDGTLGNFGAFEEYSALSVLQSYPQLINFNTTVYEYFVDQYNLCGYNLTLSYPSESIYPTLRSTGLVADDAAGSYASSANYKMRTNVDMGRMLALLSKLGQTMKQGGVEEEGDHVFIDGKRFSKRELGWKMLERRQSTDEPPPPPLPGPMGEIQPYYQCFIMEEIWEWATTYTEPWRNLQFDVYRIANALWPPAPEDPSTYLNRPDVREALHAPVSEWSLNIRYPFNSSYVHTAGTVWGDPSPEPQVFLSQLTPHVSMVLYAGNDDSLVGHRGTELAIQNMTFGGIRGFTARPSTPFYDDDGKFAGIIHQERNVTYALFDGAGHMVPRDKPQAAYVFVREFILGNNTTGLLATPIDSAASPTATPNLELAKGILEGSAAFIGYYRTEGTVTWDEELWEGWGSYMETRTEQDVPVASASNDGVIGSGAMDTVIPSAVSVTKSEGERIEIGRNRWIIVCIALLVMATAW